MPKKNSNSIKAVRCKVEYEFIDGSRKATIIFNVVRNEEKVVIKERLEFSVCHVNIPPHKWSLEDWLFLGKVSNQINEILYSDEER